MLHTSGPTMVSMLISKINYIFISGTIIMIRKFARNPFLLYSPFLSFYACIIVIKREPTLIFDEARYVQFAHNLIHGFYSPSAPHIDLWNGPGYPLILVPFIAVHVPVLYITLLNAIFQYLAVVFLYKALKLITSHRIAAYSALIFAVYRNALSTLPVLFTEPFTCLLISAFVYSITLFYVKKRPGYGIAAGMLLGYIALTKIIFGYVLMAGIFVCVALILFRKKRVYYWGWLKILVVALSVTVPYLTYTWHLTGKPLYWGNSGGMSLYWMSTPYEHEYGDWKVTDLTNSQYPNLFRSPDVVKILRKNHAKEIGFILKHNEIERDELFKQKAITNIEAHPMKFLANYCDNLSRMLFNFPYSYSYQDDCFTQHSDRFGDLVGRIGGGRHNMGQPQKDHSAC